MAKYDTRYSNSDFAWQSGVYYDTQFCTLYPPNVHASNQPIKSFSYYFPETATSLHPGGANFAFSDGSVRFLKNTIDSWGYGKGNATTYGDSLPDSVAFDGKNYLWTINGGSKVGVYQALSTRANGEVLSSDSY
jgi:prepilin-type processing-associated H-X9-DG protein